jgi:glycosyltransferase involved in cell wall biosynthesis
MANGARETFVASQEEKRVPLWVVLDLDPKKRGSLEQQLIALADKLRDSPFRPTFVFDRQVPVWLATELSERNVDIRTLNFRKPWEALFEFTRWMATERPALVHFHFFRAYSPFLMVARSVGSRIVLHDHITLGQPVSASMEHPPAVKKVIRVFKRLRALALNWIVHTRLPVSEFVASSVAEAEFVAKERIAVVENGVNVSRFIDADAEHLRSELKLGDVPIVVCVSRMAPEKGVDVLIESIAKLESDRAVLVIAGDGPDVEKCRQLAQRLGVAERVHFLGLRDDVERLFSAADVVVMPSLWDEAFGLVVVEAMAAGVPVVVTASGAMPEIVDHGACGIVVPKRDSAALANAIDSLVMDPARAAAIGERGRQRVLERYAVDRWVDRVHHIYEDLLAIDSTTASTSPSSTSPASISVSTSTLTSTLPAVWR